MWSYFKSGFLTNKFLMMNIFFIYMVDYSCQIKILTLNIKHWLKYQISSKLFKFQVFQDFRFLRNPVKTVMYNMKP